VPCRSEAIAGSVSTYPNPPMLNGSNATVIAASTHHRRFCSVMPCPSTARG
jgi:hypothetical protein